MIFNINAIPRTGGININQTIPSNPQVSYPKGEFLNSDQKYESAEKYPIIDIPIAMIRIKYCI